MVITVTPNVNTSENGINTVPPIQNRSSMWLIVGVLFGILLLMAVIPIAVCALRRNNKKLW